MVALAGCGGSGVAPTQHFAAIASTICDDADVAIAALPVPGSSLHAQARSAARELGIVRSEASQLGSLTPPASTQQRFAHALARLRTETTLAGELIAAIRAGDAPRVVTLAMSSRAADARTQTAMKALGIRACIGTARPGSR